ncbi:MAG: hypothetical protein KAH00_08770 [Cocleimonas sp.]|nr:hypothetical protein [Cocleimonas sp.]
MKYKKIFSTYLKVAMFMSCLFSLSCSYTGASEELSGCEYYAQDAVKQYKQNVQFDCGFKGIRWSNHQGGHAAWCSTVRKAISDGEKGVRDKMLKACLLGKKPMGKIKNQPNIPSSCKDPKTKYTPIKSINSWYRYERTIRMPVKNGLIKVDFNDDHHPDYVFIEKDKKQGVQLTMCVSYNNTYRRRVTKIAFSAKGDSLSSEGYHISLKDKQLHITFTYFGHNEGSSFAEGYYAYNRHQHVFELKDSISDSAGIPMGPDFKEPYPIYVPVPPKVL